MEDDVVGMGLVLLNVLEGVVGNMMSGGLESIFFVLKFVWDWVWDYKKVEG